jgi:hypothetical protein
MIDEQTASLIRERLELSTRLGFTIEERLEKTRSGDLQQIFEVRDLAGNVIDVGIPPIPIMRSEIEAGLAAEEARLAKRQQKIDERRQDLEEVDRLRAIVGGE